MLQDLERAIARPKAGIPRIRVAAGSGLRAPSKPALIARWPLLPVSCDECEVKHHRVERLIRRWHRFSTNSANTTAANREGSAHRKARPIRRRLRFTRVFRTVVVHSACDKGGLGIRATGRSATRYPTAPSAWIIG